MDVSSLDREVEAVGNRMSIHFTREIAEWAL